MKKLGLVLAGGGARTAYQVGVLKRVAELSPHKSSPFKIISGASAGSLNGAAIASGATDFKETAERLWGLWNILKVEKVVRSDFRSLSVTGIRLIFDLILGGKVGVPSSNHLLNTDPLREMLKETINFRTIRRNIRKGIISALAVTATNYHSGTNITFYDSTGEIQDWSRSQRISKREVIKLEHVMASTAIPIFFPPVKIRSSYFGDGSVRLTSPLSSAVHLGSEALLAIGIRKDRTDKELKEINNEPSGKVYIADIAGLLLNSIFMDSLESDVERFVRINRTISNMRADRVKSHPDKLKYIPLLVINPSRDLGEIAAEEFYRFPSMLKHLLKGIGATEETGSELLSYLTFDSSYTSKLLELGYADATEKDDEIREFLDGNS